MMDMPVTIKLCLCIALLLPLMLSGQVVEDFSDGNFTNGPEWTGDVNVFRVNDNFQLQLDDNKESSAFLFTEAIINKNMEWRCWTRLSFSPSGNNNARIYLSADSHGESDYPDGIFLQLGEGGSLDALRLMEQQNGDTSTLIKGAAGAIATSFMCGIKVVLENGQWRLFADYDGGNDYLLQGTRTGETGAGAAFIGVACKYTVSNSTKFYFDDFYAGPIQYDTIPPEVIHVSVADPLNIEVSFSEKMDSVSALDANNYFFTKNNLKPLLAVFSEGDQDVVILTYADSLEYGKIMELNINNVCDLSGNVLNAVIFQVVWYHASRYDVVINEIMADPSPPQFLPEYEYLELYNTTMMPLNLSAWTLEIGTAEKVLTGLKMAPGEYIILSDAEAESEFITYGTFYGLDGLSLVNTGQEIILSDKNREIVHAIKYNEKWYHDSERSEGGWSLELIDPFNPCLMEENWHASKNINGGSPGKPNSVYSESILEPQIIDACVIDSGRIRIIFNQSMGGLLTSQADLFKIDNHSRSVDAVLPEDPYFTSFIVYPSSALREGKIYSLSLNGDISNCIGDSFYASETTRIGIPEDIYANDIVINEILFNPFPGGTDYIELYNRSEKALDLSGLILASVKHNPPSPPDTDLLQIKTPCLTIMPGAYVYICSDEQKVSTYYNIREKRSCIEHDGIPAYSNESGTVMLMDASLNIIDAFSYHEDMHYPLLNSHEGISLERIHFDRPASDMSNWHSASRLSGFGTPGYRNSQFAGEQSRQGRLTIQPKVFRPGNDGKNNNVNINFSLEKPGYMVTIMILTASGSICRHLVNNELLGTNSTYSWDGIDESRQKARAGIYVLLAELVHPDGEILRFKETLVLAP